MKTTTFVMVLFLLPGLTEACSTSSQEGGDSVDNAFNEVVARERAALDRWVTGDPDGYLDILAPEVTYFDPFREERADGFEEMVVLLGPIRDVRLPFTEPRYEMIDPKMQQFGDVALLTFQLVNYGKMSGQPEMVLARWNATQVYRRIEDQWKIVHSHWSFTKPELAPATP